MTTETRRVSDIKNIELELWTLKSLFHLEYFKENKRKLDELNNGKEQAFKTFCRKLLDKNQQKLVSSSSVSSSLCSTVVVKDDSGVHENIAVTETSVSCQNDQHDNNPFDRQPAQW